jgi:hypothetical protein
MIELESINTEQYFPRIDLRLSNRSNETALFWQFALMIKNIKIDPTPSLNFWFTVDAQRHIDGQLARAHSDSLLIRSTNNGWGGAHNLELVLIQPVLASLFAPEDMRYASMLKSDETQTTMRLDASDMGSAAFEQVRSVYMEKARDDMERSLPVYLERNRHMTPENGYPPELLRQSYEQYQEEQRKEFDNQWNRGIDGVLRHVIPLNNMRMSWLCTDLHRDMHNGETLIGGMGNTGSLFLSSDGFFIEESLEHPSIEQLSLHYCPILEPDMLNQEYTFPYSNKLEPGQQKSLQLYIGNTQSCTMDVVMRFYTHDEQPYEYLVRDLKIWNPMHADEAKQFLDGDVIRRTVGDYTSTLKNKKLKHENKQVLNQARWLEDKLNNYPFLPVG